MENSMKQKILYSIPIVLFAAMIYGLGIWSAVKPDEDISEIENRSLASAPEFSWETFKDGSFGEDYDTYLCDQFVMRSTWISIKSTLEAKLGRKDIKDVYLAKDDYLIRRYTDEDFDEATVNKNINALCTFVNNYSQQMGADHVKVVMVPTAAAVLTDKLPAYATQWDESSIMNRIQDGLVFPESFIDVTEALKAKSKSYIYFRTDHHWTALGAYYAYVEWAKSCGITPTPLEDFEKETVTTDFLGTNQSKIVYSTSADQIDIYQAKDITYRVAYDSLLENATTVFDDLYMWDNLEKKDKYTVFLDGNHGLVDIETSVKNGKSLLVVKDSFAHAMLPFIINHFEHVTVVDTRYYNFGISALKPAENYTDVLVIHNTAKFMLDATAVMMNV
jgi:hypothetical protein